jgi:hypothetical protein
MAKSPDPNEANPDQQLIEISRLLAASLVRMSVTAACGSEPPDCEKSSHQGLDVRPDPRLSVHTG